MSTERTRSEPPRPAATTVSATHCARFMTAVAVAVAVAVSGCAAGGQLGSGDAQLQTASFGSFAPDGSYRLSATESALDCRRLTGRMQVRILQIRDRLGSEPNIVYQGIRSLLGTLYGSGAGSSGGNVDHATREDVAILAAYNRALAAKNCPTFDLDAELQPHPTKHTPRPK